MSFLPPSQTALSSLLGGALKSLTAQGIDKIVIVSQLQELENEQHLISFLSDVDIVIGGGSNTLLSDSTDEPGDLGKPVHTSVRRQISKTVSLLEHDAAVLDQRQSRTRDVMRRHETKHQRIIGGKVRR